MATSYVDAGFTGRNISNLFFTRIAGSGASNNTLKIKLTDEASTKEYHFFVFGLGEAGKSVIFNLYARRSNSSAYLHSLGEHQCTASISGDTVSVVIDGVYNSISSIYDAPAEFSWINTAT